LSAVPSKKEWGRLPVIELTKRYLGLNSSWKDGSRNWQVSSWLARDVALALVDQLQTADLNAKDFNNEWTVLFHAVQVSQGPLDFLNATLIAELVSANANPNITDPRGLTPLAYAITGNRFLAVLELLRGGVQIMNMEICCSRLVQSCQATILARSGSSGRSQPFASDDGWSEDYSIDDNSPEESAEREALSCVFALLSLPKILPLHGVPVHASIMNCLFPFLIGSISPNLQQNCQTMASDVWGALKDNVAVKKWKRNMDAASDQRSVLQRSVRPRMELLTRECTEQF